MNRYPTDKRKLQGCLNQEEITDQSKKSLIELWDVVLLWSGFDGFYDIREIAYQCGISQRAVVYRIEKFKRLFPEAYERLKEDRALVRRVAARHGKASKTPLSWDDLDPDLRDAWVREKW